MFYVGIDIAKQKHFASVMSSDGEVLTQPFGFTNDYAGFSTLLSKLQPFNKSEVLIGLESTAHYGENLISFLFDLGYNLCVINPIQTASLRKSNIRKTKTDKVDTFLIIKALSLNNYRLFTKRDYDTISLKYLCRFRQKLMKSRTKNKIQLVSFVDLLFPEFQYFFKSGLHIKSSYELLKKHSSPQEIYSLHLTYLTNLLKASSKGHFNKNTAIALKELAKTSVGIKNDVLSIQITQTIAQIELLDKQINDVENSISTVMNSINSVIMTIPGIGDLNGAMILGEVGDINRFSSSCKLLAYAGLDPSVNQSGNFTAKRTKMSKRGSKILRFALMNAAWNATLNNKTFKDYYDSKMAQGRMHYNAIGHVAHKLVRVIHKMLTDNIAFDLE